MSLADDMKKVFGDLSKTKSQRAKFFSTGFPPLDKIISGSYQGGIPVGNLVEIYGASGSGKTFLATEIMKSAQSLGGCAMFVDFERRFRPDFAERRGLRLEQPSFVYTSPPTWEQGNAQAIQFAEMIRKSGEYSDEMPIVVVIDSIAAAIPESVLVDKTKTGDAALDRGKHLCFNMSDTTSLARATSATLKIIAHYAKELNMTMIYLNQVREKPGISYGSNETCPGGRATEFFADVRIQLTKSMEKDGKEVTGQSVTAKTVKNAITRPFQIVSWLLSFEDDGATVMDREASLVDYMVDIGAIVTPTSGYVEWEGAKTRKKSLVKAIKQTGQYDKLIKMLIDFDNATKVEVA